MTWRIIEHVRKQRYDANPPHGDWQTKPAYNVWVNDDSGKVVYMNPGDHPEPRTMVRGLEP